MRVLAVIKTNGVFTLILFITSITCGLEMYPKIKSQNSRYLDTLRGGDGVLADRGFQIRNFVI